VAYLTTAPPMSFFMRRYGYKKGIHIGLGLFSIGAVMFWPAAKFAYYGMVSRYGAQRRRGGLTPR
jgi:FHS family L-fucose permease-like MFS transporter